MIITLILDNKMKNSNNNNNDNIDTKIVIIIIKKQVFLLCRQHNDHFCALQITYLKLPKTLKCTHIMNKQL